MPLFCLAPYHPLLTWHLIPPSSNCGDDWRHVNVRYCGTDLWLFDVMFSNGRWLPARNRPQLIVVKFPRNGSLSVLFRGDIQQAWTMLKGKQIRANRLAENKETNMVCLSIHQPISSNKMTESVTQLKQMKENGNA